MKPTLYEMAAAVAIKIQQIDRRVELTPEQVLRKGTPDFVRFMYGKICKGGVMSNECYRTADCNRRGSENIRF